LSEFVDGQEYFSVTEAAQIIGWNRATVFEWVKDLKMQKYKFLRNKNTYLKADDVKRLLEIKQKPWAAGEKPATDEDARVPLVDGAEFGHKALQPCG
jgi:hypothetical protein